MGSSSDFVVKNSHFIDEKMCINKLGQLRYMREAIDILNSGSCKAPPRILEFSNALGLLLVYVGMYLMFKDGIINSGLFTIAFIITTIVFVFTVKRAMNLPRNYAEHFIELLGQYKPVEQQSYNALLHEISINEGKINLINSISWINEEERLVKQMIGAPAPAPANQ